MSLPVWTVLFASAAAVFVCCFVLLLSKDYHAGAIGNFGLGMVALAALSRMSTLADYGVMAWASAPSVLLWLGLALFLGRHVVKFVFRSARRGPTWYPR